MKYLKEFDVEKFSFHDGAKDVYEAVKAEGKLDELQSLINGVFDNQTPTEGEVNDYVWFNAQEVYETIGLA